jgi:3-methyladenine DNA glycosylase AlkD
MVLNRIRKDLDKLKNPAKAKILAGFFKTNKGEYGAGDIFLGISVSKQRQIAKKYFGTGLKILQELLKSKIHEERLTTLFILIDNYEKADETEKEKIVNFYLKNTKYINNWDLVDLSAPKIIGDYFFKKDKSILYKLVKSNILWERRIAIIATAEFIKNNQFKDTLKISQLLLDDKQDLIHKAVGWMLREIGKRDQKIEEEFLKKYYKKMPRTMLRYAIEKFTENKRQTYLKGRF